MNNSCLIIVDVQKAIFKMKQPVFNDVTLINNLVKILNFTRNNNIQVAYSQHENNTFLKSGTADWKIIEDIEPKGEDILVHKKQQSIFDQTDLHDKLQKLNISKILIAGLISNGCIKESCIGAIKLNYDVILIKDGHSTFYKNAEKIIDNTNNELMKTGVNIRSCEEILNAYISNDL